MTSRVPLPLLLPLLTLLSACGGTTGPEIVDEFENLRLRQSVAGEGGYVTVAFVDRLTGVIAGYNGAMDRTTDGGGSWRTVEQNGRAVFTDLAFANGTSGYAVGYMQKPDGPFAESGLIRATDDGGATWRDVLVTDKPIELQSIAVVGDRIAVAVGYASVFTTRDGGESWEVQGFEGEGIHMDEVLFVNESIGFISSSTPVFLRTDDGGESWERIDLTLGSGLFALAAIDRDTIIGAGHFGIAKSTDGGRTWRAIDDTPTGIFALHFTDERRGYALGRGNYSGGDFGNYVGSLFITDDGGETWRGTMEVLGMYEIRAASFPDDSVGYAVGMNKVMKIEVN